MHCISIWHDTRVGSSFNYLQTYVVTEAWGKYFAIIFSACNVWVCAGVCEGVVVLARIWLCMHQCALCVSVCRLGAPAFSFGLRQISVYYVLIIVLGHKSHWGILPPCKLILCYYQFTSATPWKWNLAGESNGKVRIICLDEIISKNNFRGKKKRKTQVCSCCCV